MRIPACLLLLLFAVSVSAQTRVIIRSKKTVLVRSGKLARDFPSKKTATITQPVFSGLPPSVLKQLRTTLALKNIFGSTLTQYREDAWLEAFTYKIHFNQQGILDIAYTQSGSGAYPDEQTKHFVIDLKSGHTIKASDVFLNPKKLAALVDSKLQDEIVQILAETGEEGKSAYEGRQNLRFEVEELENFSIGPTGLTFMFDAGFPHVIQALQPNGNYFLSFVDLKPYLRPEGQLGQFIR